MKTALCLEIITNSISYTIGVDQERGIIGRGPLADIRVPFATISSAHIEFKRVENTFFFKELGSTNGTFIDNKKIKANQWFEIKKEVTLRVVDTQLVFRVEPGLTPHFTMVQSGTLARKLLMDVLAAKGNQTNEDAFLEALSGPDKGVRLTLHDAIDHLEIGGATGEFRFPAMTPAVIATIIRDGDGFSILPKGTIFVNGTATTKATQLSNEIELEMGRIRFRFIDPLEAYFSAMDKGGESQAKIESDSESAVPVNALEKSIQESYLTPIEPRRDELKSIPNPSSALSQEKNTKKKDWLLIVVILVAVSVGATVIIGVLSL